MNADKLLQILSRIHPMTNAFKKALESELIGLSLPKNYLLMDALKIADHVYFLNHGFAISYTFQDGSKQIESFWKTHQLIISSKSFFEQVPTGEFIQLMVQSDLLCISHAGVLRLFDRFPATHLIYRTLMSKHDEWNRQRIRDLKTLNAEQRYKKLLTTYSNIEQIVSQEQIASYLGITPQSLSRIKRKEFCKGV